MGRKVLKTVESDADAGTYDERVYDKALNPWRSKLRRMLLSIIRQETYYIAKMQETIRTPLLDNYFLWTANLGTHTFFMIFLPVFVWFDTSFMAVNVVCLTAFGVFVSGFIKDLMCLPRPLSPPVHRLTMSRSTSLEYGFPSTHSTNSVSAALLITSMACENLPADSPWRLVYMTCAGIYATSIVFGRLYCGMHSLTDVIGGSILGYVVYWCQWTFRGEFERLLTNDSFLGVLASVVTCLALVGLHPDPIDRCPCFEDSVCFMGVLIGAFPGFWMCTHSEYCGMGRVTLALSESPLHIAALVCVTKLVFGVTILFAWRLVCKKACYVILPPIYRAFNLPHRKFEIGARTYKTLYQESIHPIPSVLDLQDLSKSVVDAEHVGIQSDIDLHERRSYDALQRQQHACVGDEKCEVFDPTMLLVAEDAPLRYDVDIVTKLIVYAGIGFFSLFIIPVMFQALGLSS